MPFSSALPITYGLVSWVTAAHLSGSSFEYSRKPFLIFLLSQPQYGHLIHSQLKLTEVGTLSTFVFQNNETVKSLKYAWYYWVSESPYAVKGLISNINFIAVITSYWVALCK